MSGLPEIIQWVQNEIDLEQFNDVESAFQFINDIFINDNRNDLESILLDDQPAFEKFLEGRISQPEEPEDPITTGMRDLFG